MPWRHHIVRARLDESRVRMWCDRVLTGGTEKPRSTVKPSDWPTTCDACQKAMAFHTGG